MRLESYVVCVITSLSLFTACGRIGYDPLEAGTRDGGDGGIATFDSLGPFGDPTLVAEVSDPSVNDDDPTLTADMLEMYLNTSRADGLGGGDIYVSTRASTDEPWSAPTLVVELSSADRETAPEISADGLTIFFSSDRPGGPGSNDVWVSTRGSRTEAWATPMLVAELSSPEGDTSPTPGWRGLTMVLESTRPGGPGSADIWFTTRESSDGTWTAPVLLAGVDTAEHEGSAHLGPNRLTVLLNATRGGNADIHVATRSSVDEPFGTPTPVAELNSVDNEQDPWLSEDLRHIYFVSGRSGNLEIYEASR